MNNGMKFIDIFLDGLKRILVRFRDAKFGFMFFINIFKLPDFFTDRRINIISKARVLFALGSVLIYLISGIDFIPEMILGMFGFFDDFFVIIWCLGIVNEEIEKYKRIVKEDEDPNIIEGIDFHIHDEKE